MKILLRVPALLVFIFLAAAAQAQTCVLTNVSAPNILHTGAAGSASLTVQSAGGGCSWSASLIGADTSWVTLTGPTTGTTSSGANITVSYSYTANNGSSGRHVALSVSTSSGSSFVFGIDQQPVNLVPLVLTCTNGDGPTVVGTSYSNTCSASGGGAPYFGYVDGALPAGLSASYGSNSVTITGTPTTPGPYNFTVRIIDSAFAAGQVATRNYQGSISPLGINCQLNTGSQPPSVTYDSNGGSGSFSVTPTASGCTWSVTVESNWVSLQGPTSGTTNANVPITIPYTVNVNTGANRGALLQLATSSGTTASRMIYQTRPNLTPLSINCSTEAGPTAVGVAYSATCTASGGSPPYLADVVPGGLVPYGVTATPSQSGMSIAGTPNMPMAYTYEIRIRDSAPVLQQTVTKVFSGTVSAGNCTIGAGFQQLLKTIAPEGGASSVYFVPGSTGCAWSASSNADWLTLQNPTSGTTSGLQNVTVGFNVAPYIGNTKRTAKIDLTMSGGTLTFTIEQQPVATSVSLTCSNLSGPERVGVAYSSTCTASGGTTPYTLQVSSGVLPAGVAFANTPTTITIQGTPTAAGPYQYTIGLTDSTIPTQGTTRQFSGTILPPLANAPTLTCSNSAGPSQVGLAYSATCSATGGTPPYQFSISQGSLPLGITFSSSAASISVQGSPTTAQSFSYRVQVTDNASQTASQPFEGSIAQAQGAPLSITCSTALGPVKVGTYYSANCTAFGGTPPYRFVVSNSPVPPGLTTSTTAATITIEGTPTVPDSYRYIVSVIDEAAIPQSASQIFQGTIAPGPLPLSFSCSPSTGPTQANVPYASTCTASGGNLPYAFSVSPSLPQGLSYNSSASTITVQGSASAPGPYQYTVTVTDGSAPTASRSVVFSGTLSAPQPVQLSCASLASSRVGEPYLAQCTPSNGTAPYTFRIAQGTLPAGLSLSPSSSALQIKGTPTTSQSYRLTITVADSSSLVQTASAILEGTISPAGSPPLRLHCEKETGPSMTGIHYGNGCVAIGGTPPYAYSWAGDIPAGIVVFVSSGGGSQSLVAAGTPTKEQSYSYNLTITDSATPPKSSSVTYSGLVRSPDAGCTLTDQPINLSLHNYSISTGGGSGTLTTTFGARNCAYSVVSSASWLKVQTGSSGVTSASSDTQAYTTYVLQPNLEATPRWADLAIIVGGHVARTYSITQNSPACKFELSPNQIDLPSIGGAFKFSITSTPAGCEPQLNPSSLLSGLVVNGAQGSGFLSPNSGPARSGTLSVGANWGDTPSAEATLTVRQAAGNPGLQVHCERLEQDGAGQGNRFSILCRVAGGTPPYRMEPLGTSAASVSYTPFRDTVQFSISGTGSYDVSLRVTDSATPAATVISERFEGQLSSTPMYVSCQTDEVVLGQEAFLSCRPSGGVPPYRWQITAGAVPPGLTGSTGNDGSAVFRGVPTVVGRQTFNLRFTDSSPIPLTVHSGTQVTVRPAPRVACSPSLGPAKVGIAYYAECSADHEIPPFVLTVNGPLPAGLRWQQNGPRALVISGTPVEPGVYTYAVVLSGTSGTVSAQKTFTGTIAGASTPLLSVAPATLTYRYVLGSGNTPAAQSLSVFSSNGTTEFSTSVRNASWLTSAAGGSTPRTVNVSIDTTPFSVPGLYEGEVVISAPGASPSTLAVPVQIIVDKPSPPALSFSQTEFNLKATPNSAGRVQYLTLTNTGTGTFSYRYTSFDTPWIQAQGSGEVVAGRPASISFTVNPYSLAPGAYSGEIEFYSLDGTVLQRIRVALTVSYTQATLGTSTSWLAFTGVAGGAVTPPQVVRVSNLGVGTMPWSASAGTYSGVPWLSVSPASAPDAGQITVTADPSKLSPGRHFGYIWIQLANNQGASHVTVSLTVLSTPDPASPSISPLGLLLTGAEPTANLTLRTNSATELGYTTTVTTADGVNWLSAPGGGLVPPNTDHNLPVSAVLGGLGPGIREGTVRVAFADGTVAAVSVLLVIPSQTSVNEAPRSAAASCSPTRLAPLFTTLGPQFVLRHNEPVSIRAIVVDSCAVPVTSGNVVLSLNQEPGFPLRSAGEGIWEGTWIPSITADSATIRLSVQNNGLNGETSLSGAIREPLETFDALPHITAVVNAASFDSPGQTAPGAWISIFGQNLAESVEVASGGFPTSLAGTQVTLGGSPLLLHSVSPTQINALVPGELQPGTQHPLLVRRNAVISAATDVAVASVLPGAYSLPLPFLGQAAALIGNTGSIAASADSYPNARPVRRGEYLEIYLTGLGETTFTPPYGSAAPSTQLARTTVTPSVTIGGVEAPVSFSGLTPGTVGLYQVNVQVPAGAPSGDAVPIVIKTGDRVAKTVTVAVE